MDWGWGLCSNLSSAMVLLGILGHVSFPVSVWEFRPHHTFLKCQIRDQNAKCYSLKLLLVSTNLVTLSVQDGTVMPRPECCHSGAAEMAPHSNLVAS